MLSSPHPDASLPLSNDQSPAEATPADRTTRRGERGRPLEVLRTLGRLALGGTLLFAGTGHLTTLRQEFQAQVPPWMPLDPDVVVVASGVVELGLGAALILAPRPWRPAVGWVSAAFFVAIFPGNISQYLTGTDAFGLDSDTSRLVRLFFQPVLVAWALWSTGAWRAWRSRDAREARGTDFLRSSFDSGTPEGPADGGYGQ